MKIGILQLNFKIGDFKGNLNKILQGYHRLVKDGAELVVCSELALFGYPPGDMLLRKDYLDRQDEYLGLLYQQVGPVGLIIGIASRRKTQEGLSLLNSAILIKNQEPIYSQDKLLLPNYDVFDERRYFEPGCKTIQMIHYNELKLGLLICEDIWSDYEIIDGHCRYHERPIAAFENQSMDALLTINASPFYMGKNRIRKTIASDIAQKIGCPLVYVNQVGGNDELIFDGHSFAVGKHGEIIMQAKGFEEDTVFVDLKNVSDEIEYKDNDIKDLHDALILGTRDYVHKSIGDQKVAIALSGGIDSAVTAYIASQAVGPENVFGIGMPSEFSSDSSVNDAIALAQHLNFRIEVIPITEVYHSFGRQLKPIIGWRMPGTKANDVTEENVQARIRGIYMMAISNRLGGIVLSTGNKSELSLGYCTLYGDMAGGFAVLSDVLKTQVYKLAKYINREKEIIPWNTIQKAPSAELRPGQLDEDSLPAYEILDPILDDYIEKGLSANDIIKKGFKKETVMWIISRINANEYKRRQMAPGLKVTQKAFGCGRRMPIAATC